MLGIAGQPAGPIELDFLWTLAVVCFRFKRFYFFPRATPGPSASIFHKNNLTQHYYFLTQLSFLINDYT